jgi:hypothetical protein
MTFEVPGRVGWFLEGGTAGGQEVFAAAGRSASTHRQEILELHALVVSPPRPLGAMQGKVYPTQATLGQAAEVESNPSGEREEPSRRASGVSDVVPA